LVIMVNFSAGFNKTKRTYLGGHYFPKRLSVSLLAGLSKFNGVFNK
jgi:hypothetical protein